MTTTQAIARVSTNEGRPCVICGSYLNGTDDFQACCNHLLEHGMKVLHVGQETVTSNEGEPWQTTVAILGM